MWSGRVADALHLVAIRAVNGRGRRYRTGAVAFVLCALGCGGGEPASDAVPATAANQVDTTVTTGPMIYASFHVVNTVEVGAAPHGIRFSEDGDTAYVAVSGDGEIAVIDIGNAAVVDRFPAGDTPLDLIQTGDGWTVTQFQGSTLVGAGGGTAGAQEVGRGPSLFTPDVVDGRVWVTSEFADRLTEVDATTGDVVRSFETGVRPYPGAVTQDGSLAFVPNLTDGTVTVIDLLEGRTIAEPEVCPGPAGGALSTGDVSFLVACGGSDELAFLNTASFEVTARIGGLGPRPFSVAVTADGRWAVVNNAGGSTVSIVSVPEQRLIRNVEVGEQPIVVRTHPDGGRVLVANEVSGTVSILGPPGETSESGGGEENEVLVLGMIHGDHRTSERYSTDVLADILRGLNPDYVFVEIPPNRFDAALTQFEETGEITEPRVLRFPEYVDVLFPLTREMDFEVVPTAGWNETMSDYRAKRLDEISRDPAWAERWELYQEAIRRSDEALATGGALDDPLWISTDAYDEAQDIRLSAYNELFNDHIGPGGWDKINRAHYGHIDAALDSLSGEGARIVITYGAGHKGWFLRELRRRRDIRVLDPVPLIQRALDLR